MTIIRAFHSRVCPSHLTTEEGSLLCAFLLFLGIMHFKGACWPSFNRRRGNSLGIAVLYWEVGVVSLKCLRLSMVYNPDLQIPPNYYMGGRQHQQLWCPTFHHQMCSSASVTISAEFNDSVLTMCV